MYWHAIPKHSASASQPLISASLETNITRFKWESIEVLFFSTNSEHHRQSIRRFQTERSNYLAETPFWEGRDERIFEEGADVELLFEAFSTVLEEESEFLWKWFYIC